MFISLWPHKKAEKQAFGLLLGGRPLCGRIKPLYAAKSFFAARDGDGKILPSAPVRRVFENPYFHTLPSKTEKINWKNENVLLLVKLLW